jgi:hypothetical protein
MVRRWLAGFGIAAYLSALLFGVVAHATHFHEGSHPSMYFIVWDMFCGWSAYESRTHIIGQGISGKYYELAPGPWSDYHPYGDIGRQHYDVFNSYPREMALNTLKHTRHEPMSRLFVVEECWAKKYNLPDPIWERRYAETKQPFSYFRLRTEMTPEGQIVRNTPTWLTYQNNLTISDNPRLLREAHSGTPMFHVRPTRDVSWDREPLTPTMPDQNVSLDDPALTPVARGQE